MEQLIIIESSVRSAGLLARQLRINLPGLPPCDKFYVHLKRP